MLTIKTKCIASIAGDRKTGRGSWQKEKKKMKEMRCLQTLVMGQLCPMFWQKLEIPKYMQKKAERQVCVLKNIFTQACKSQKKQTKGRYS